MNLSEFKTGDVDPATGRVAITIKEYVDSATNGDYYSYLFSPEHEEFGFDPWHVIESIYAINPTDDDTYEVWFLDGRSAIIKGGSKIIFLSAKDNAEFWANEVDARTRAKPKPWTVPKYTLEEFLNLLEDRDIYPHFVLNLNEELTASKELVDSLETANKELAVALKNPNTVHAAMLRGMIAVPSWRNLVDLRGEVPNGEEVQLRRIAELQEENENLKAQLALFSLIV